MFAKLADLPLETGRDVVSLRKRQNINSRCMTAVGGGEGGPLREENGYAAINLTADTDCIHKSIDLLNQLNRFINFDAEIALRPFTPPRVPRLALSLLILYRPPLSPCPPARVPLPALLFFRELIDLSAVINFAPKVSHV